MATAPTADRAEILRTWRIFRQSGEVLELRIPEAGRYKTISGYFNDPGKLADAVIGLADEPFPGIYFSVNPVKPELLARAANRYVKYAKITTSNADITALHWLPIDIDPQKPAGISATAAEHEAAISKTWEIMHWLIEEQEWPAGAFVLADSGNGGHLNIKIDLENSSENVTIIKRCLEALDFLFSDELAGVDITSQNPARIWKLYGTMVRKGDNLPERPHRLAQLLEVPDRLEAITKEKLKALAAMLPQQEERPKSYTGQGFDPIAYCQAHNLQVHHTKPYNGGVLAVLEECIFDSSHRLSACIIGWPSGARTYRCRHHSCLSKHWADAKAAIEGEGYPSRLNKNSRRLEEIRQEAQRAKGTAGGHGGSGGDPGQEKGGGEAHEISEEDLLKIKIPENPRFKTLLEHDNFIQEYTRYGETVTDGYQDYWFAGGLFCISVAVNRNAVIKLRQGPVYPNVWINEIGLSSLSRKSTGIDKTDITIAAANIDPDCKMPDEFSPEAMIERLDQHPRAYMLKDESAGLLAVMKKDYMRGLKDALMQLYDGKDINRELRTSRRKSDKTKFQVRDPYLCLMLATTPGSFAANTELLDVVSGWLPRFLHFFPNHIKERWLPLEEGVPENDLLSAKCQVRLIKIRQAFYDRSVPLAMHLSKEADAYFKAWQKAREAELVDAKDDRKAQFYSRLAVYALKMGMLFTIGRADYEEGMELSLDHIKEACRLVDEYFMPMAMTVADLVGKAADKNNLDKVIAILTSQGGKMKRRELGRKSHLRAKDLDDTLESLRDFGEIEIVTVSNPRGEPSIWITLSQDNENRNTVTTVITGIHDIPSHHKENKKDNEDINTVTRCDSNDGNASLTVCDGKNDPPFPEEYLDEALTCRRIKKALSEGITDPLKLAEVVGLPVCLVAKFPGVNSIAAAGIQAKLEAHRREQHFQQLAEQHITKQQRLQMIYIPQGPAGEYSGLAFNPWIGCGHGCKYCYGPAQFHKTREEFLVPELKKDMLRRLEADLKYHSSDVPLLAKCGKEWIEVSAEQRSGPVFMMFGGDLYSPPWQHSDLPRKILELFNKYKVPFDILTKAGTKAVSDFDLYIAGCRFWTTLTFDNNEDSKKWEPAAALPADRIAAMQMAHEHSIKTCVSFEPVLDPAQTLYLIELTSPHVDEVYVGKLNTRGKNLPAELEKIERQTDWLKFKVDAINLLKKLGKPYEIKIDLLKAAEPVRQEATA